MPESEQITISRAKYEELDRAATFLAALECAGVDNWAGYPEARRIFQEMIEESVFVLGKGVGASHEGSVVERDAGPHVGFVQEDR